MTDRINALTVVLAEDMRDDDCEYVISAIRMIRHVLSVQPHVADFTSHVAYTRVRAEFRQKVLDAVEDVGLGR